MWAALVRLIAWGLGLIFSKPADSEVFRQAGADAQKAQSEQEAARDAKDANRIRSDVDGASDDGLRNDKSGFWRD